MAINRETHYRGTHFWDKPICFNGFWPRKSCVSASKCFRKTLGGPCVAKCCKSLCRFWPFCSWLRHPNLSELWVVNLALTDTIHAPRQGLWPDLWMNLVNNSQAPDPLVTRSCYVEGLYEPSLVVPFSELIDSIGNICFAIFCMRLVCDPLLLLADSLASMIIHMID